MPYLFNFALFVAESFTNLLISLSYYSAYFYTVIFNNIKHCFFSRICKSKWNVFVRNSFLQNPCTFYGLPYITVHLRLVYWYPICLSQGDVLVEVHAEDGDKGSPRELRYGVVSEGTPFTSFFNIDQNTGRLIFLLSEHNRICNSSTICPSTSFIYRACLCCLNPKKPFDKQINENCALHLQKCLQP